MRRSIKETGRRIYFCNLRNFKVAVKLREDLTKDEKIAALNNESEDFRLGGIAPNYKGCAVILSFCARYRFGCAADRELPVFPAEALALRRRVQDGARPSFCAVLYILQESVNTYSVIIPVCRRAIK